MRKIILLTAILFASILSYAHCKPEKKLGDPIVAINITEANTKKPLADVTITAIHTATKTEHTFTTDANGQVKINQLPFGSYKFKFEKENYKTVEKKEIIVKPDATLKLSIEIINYKDEDYEENKKWLLKFDL